MLRRILKVAAVLILVGVAAFFYFRKSQGMEMPSGTAGTEADRMAERMMDALGYSQWQETRLVQWTFAGVNHYLWDRSNGIVEVRSGDGRVVLNIQDKDGVAYEKRELLSGEAHQEAIEAAWSNFCNDSFWLIAPFKAMDPGSRRESVETEEGEGLLITYGTGGVTPGDSYLWYISDDGYPHAYRMWTQILPIPGLRSSWEDWQTIHTGAMISTKHSMGPMDLMITDLRTGSEFSDLDLKEDYFE